MEIFGNSEFRQSEQKWIREYYTPITFNSCRKLAFHFKIFLVILWLGETGSYSEPNKENSLKGQPEIVGSNEVLLR